MKKRLKIGLFAAGGILVLCVGFAFAAIAFGSRSTHSASIRIQLTGYETVQDRVAEYEMAFEKISRWAPEAGFRRVDPERERVHLSWFSSAANGNERITHFKEAHPANPKWPIEILIVYDPDGSSHQVDLSLCEGYGRKPSLALQRTVDSLTELLKSDYGDQVKARVW